MLKKLALISSLCFLFTMCNKVPVSGRRQLNLIPSSEVLSLSTVSYQNFLNENKVVTGTSQSIMVNTVGLKIKDAVQKYMNDNGMSDELDGFEWKFNTVESEEANAFCMPGGKVVFYTGILPICQDEAGVAVVMGHEVAHAIAKHGNERMSQGLVQQFGGAALSVALSDKPAQTQQLFQTAYGVGSQVGVMLPFSRLQESEADELGLIFMAMAGYNPHEAPEFWERMSAKSGGGAPPEFLSTHPSHETRIKNLNKAIPKAMEYYKQ